MSDTEIDFEGVDLDELQRSLYFVTDNSVGDQPALAVLGPVAGQVERVPSATVTCYAHEAPALALFRHSSHCAVPVCEDCLKIVNEIITVWEALSDQERMQAALMIPDALACRFCGQVFLDPEDLVVRLEELPEE